MCASSYQEYVLEEKKVRRRKRKVSVRVRSSEEVEQKFAKPTNVVIR